MEQHPLGNLRRAQRVFLESRGQLQSIFANRYTAATRIESLALEPGEKSERTQSGWGSLYLVEQGVFELHLQGAGNVRANCGALVAVPSGRAHSCISREGARLLVIRVSNNAQLLPGLLPPVLCISRSEIRGITGLLTTLDLLREFSADDDPVTELITCRLADILAMSMLRHLLRKIDAPLEEILEEGFDSRIRTAIAAIHRHPERAWTVAALAQAVNLSRSSFAARFSQVVGEPPMQYLARIRVNLASSYLQSRDWSVADIAQMVGYRSEGAFINAFQRIMNTSPGRFRRKTRAGE